MTKIKTGSDFSGVGAFDVAMNRIGVQQTKNFACDMDKFARRNYLANFGTESDLELLEQKEVKFIDSVYYRQYNSVKKPTKEEIKKATELAKIYAHKFSFYYPWDVYEREIPNDSLDIYMTSPPCQAFSLAGKRKGKEDLRGILFFNSLEFIQKNKPKTFIFENVKGLLSDDSGKTFQEWINFLGGCSVNGVPTIFPYDDSVPYHIFWTVLNAKKHGVPQNRERVFIVGIRDGLNASNFQWPKEVHLTKKLKNILDPIVDEKYFLSESALKGLINDSINQEKKGFGFIFKPKNYNEISNTISTKESQRKTGTYVKIGTCQKQNRHGIYDGFKIRTLTPTECFRLMDFPDEHVQNAIKAGISDSQLYKQAGNSIVTKHLADIGLKLLNIVSLK